MKAASARAEEELERLALSLEVVSGVRLALVEGPAVGPVTRRLRRRLEPDLEVRRLCGGLPEWRRGLESRRKGRPRLFVVEDLAAAPRPQRLRFLRWLNVHRDPLEVVGDRVLLVLEADQVPDLPEAAPDLWSSAGGIYELTGLAEDGAAPGEEPAARYCRWLQAELSLQHFTGLLQLRTLEPLPLEDLYVPLQGEVDHEEVRAQVSGQYGRELTTDDPLVQEAIRRTRRRTRGPGGGDALSGDLQGLCDARGRAVVLGDPGSGKSTFLKHLALQAARSGARTFLPVLVPLLAYDRRRVEQPDLSLEEFVATWTGEQAGTWARDLLLERWDTGPFLLLLDGLDEVLDPDRRSSVRDQVERLAAEVERRGGRVVVTSRRTGYHAAPLGPAFSVLRVRPLEDEAIRDYLHRFGRALARARRIPESRWPRLEAGMGELFKSLRANPNLLQMARTPLLLALLALIHQLGTRLPERRVELYRLCVEALAETWNRARSLSGGALDLQLRGRRLDAIYLANLVAPVAFWMQSQGRSLVGAEELVENLALRFQEVEGLEEPEARPVARDFLRLAAEQTGILVEQGTGQFAFLHLGLQEYLAARYLASRLDPLEPIRQELHQARWQEVLRLCAAVLEGERAGAMVGAIAAAGSPDEPTLARDTRLAATCLLDDPQLSLPQARPVVSALHNAFARTDLSVVQEATWKLARGLSQTRFALLQRQLFEERLEGEIEPRALDLGRAVGWKDPDLERRALEWVEGEPASCRGKASVRYLLWARGKGCRESYLDPGKWSGMPEDLTEALMESGEWSRSFLWRRVRESEGRDLAFWLRACAVAGAPPRRLRARLWKLAASPDREVRQGALSLLPRLPWSPRRLRGLLASLGRLDDGEWYEIYDKWLCGLREPEMLLDAVLEARDRMGTWRTCSSCGYPVHEGVVALIRCALDHHPVFADPESEDGWATIPGLEVYLPRSRPGELAHVVTYEDTPGLSDVLERILADLSPEHQAAVLAHLDTPLSYDLAKKIRKLLNHRLPEILSRSGFLVVGALKASVRWFGKDAGKWVLPRLDSALEEGEVEVVRAGLELFADRLLDLPFERVTSSLALLAGGPIGDVEAALSALAAAPAARDRLLALRLAEPLGVALPVENLLDDSDDEVRRLARRRFLVERGDPWRTAVGKLPYYADDLYHFARACPDDPFPADLASVFREALADPRHPPWLRDRVARALEAIEQGMPA